MKKNFFKYLKIKPVFVKNYLFIGVIPFEYSGEGFCLMILPTLGFVIRWDGFSDLAEDLKKVGWSK